MLGWVLLVIGLLFALLIGVSRLARKPPTGASVRTLIVLGSGGHTAELVSLVTRLNAQQYRPRLYVVAATDRLGPQKAQACEEKLNNSGGRIGGELAAEVWRIPRSREVGQSFITAALSTGWALLVSTRIVARLQPDLVLVNGPGTCLPICLATRICRLLGRTQGKLVYLESIARVNSLSLSGKLLYSLRLTDAFFVQWPELQAKFKRTRYCGRLY